MTRPRSGQPSTDEARARRILAALHQTEQIDRKPRSLGWLYWLTLILLLLALLVVMTRVGRQLRQYWQQLVRPEAHGMLDTLSRDYGACLSQPDSCVQPYPARLRYHVT